MTDIRAERQSYPPAARTGTRTASDHDPSWAVLLVADTTPALARVRTHPLRHYYVPPTTSKPALRS